MPSDIFVKFNTMKIDIGKLIAKWNLFDTVNSIILKFPAVLKLAAGDF